MMITVPTPVRYAILVVLIICGIIVYCIVKRKYANPKTSYTMAAINIFLHPLRILQIGLLKDPVVVKDAMKDAISTTKLRDFGDLHFVDNYKAISDLPFYKSLKFSNLGLVMAKMEMQIGLCSRRLLMMDYFKKYPDIESIPVPSPLFVIGLGRSGTTFLHRLLSLDNDVRSPFLWELMCPVPEVKKDYNIETKDEFRADRDKRANDARKQIAGLNSLGDKTMENIHEVNADFPEECIVGLSDEIPISFHYLYSYMANMTEFCQMIPPSRVVAAYKTYKKILQLLSYQVGEGVAGRKGDSMEGSGRRRWVLKSPLHSVFLPELLKVFPDAKFIWPHRNPIRCLSSHCSIMQGLHLMYYERDCLQPKELGKTVLRENQFMISKALAFAENVKDKDCAHVMYDDLVMNPIDIVAQIYKQFEWKFTDEYKAKLMDYLDADNARREAVKKSLKNTSGSQSLNDNTLADFGLCPDDLKTDVYKKYNERFSVDQLKY